jgi:hypothetical protein
MNYARGVKAEVGGTGVALPDNDEIDLTLDFHPTAGPFEGSWLRIRYGVLNPGTNRKRCNVRVTFNWASQLI